MHKDSSSYRVYLGVVPASMIKNDPKLVDGDKSLHGGIPRQTPEVYHVLVAIYNKNDNSRVKDATVIAEVSANKLLNRRKTVKPLEKMITSGQITYGNYFKLESKGKYEIEAIIYESDRDGYEKVEFAYVIK